MWKILSIWAVVIHFAKSVHFFSHHLCNTAAPLIFYVKRRSDQLEMQTLSKRSCIYTSTFFIKNSKTINVYSHYIFHHLHAFCHRTSEKTSSLFWMNRKMSMNANFNVGGFFSMNQPVQNQSKFNFNFEDLRLSIRNPCRSSNL